MLRITTPPVAEPVTLAEVKSRLRLTSTDDDDVISSQITAAREFAEKATRQSLCTKGYTLTLDRAALLLPFALPMPPLQSVSAVTYLDPTLTTQTLDPALYYVAANRVPALLVRKPGLYPPEVADIPGAVEVTYVAGYQDCPEMLKEGIRQLAVHMYEHPEAVSAERLEEIPLALRSFFAAHRVYSF